MGIRMPGALHSHDGSRDDLTMCQDLRHNREGQSAGLFLPPLQNFLEELEREIFKLRTPIGNQSFAHRAGNVDSRRSVTIAPLDKHRFEFGEQALDALPTENADRQPIKQKVVPSQLVK